MRCSVVLLMALLAACANSGAPVAPESAGDAPAAVASPPAQLNAVTWTDRGRLLSAIDFGQPAGSIVGDPTGVLLADGRIRLFVFVDGRGVWRAISTDTTGTAFRVEGPCTLIPHTPTNTRGTPWGEPRVVVTPSGLRMFYMQDGGIASATSTDHVVWRQEPGLRITAAQAGMRATTTGSLVSLADGRFRLFFSELRSTPADSATRMRSATSSDQLTWTMDPGVRIGPGALRLDENATDPFAYGNADGSVTAWYLAQPAPGSNFQGQTGIYSATATDGLTFATSSRTTLPGGNPNVIVRRDGTPLMFLSANDPTTGPSVRLAIGRRN